MATVDEARSTLPIGESASGVIAAGVISLDAQAVRGDSNLRRSFRRLRHNRMAILGSMMLGFVLLYIIIGSIAFPESKANFNDPTRQLEAPSTEHPFGTDSIGRDILARTIYGGQISIFIAVTAVIVEITLGTLVGLLSGYFGGIVDSILMRFTEAMLSIPQLFIGLIAARVFANRLPDFQIGQREFSNTLIVIIFVIGLTSWMRVARIVRSVVFATKEQEFITAARAIGAQDRRIILQHVLPNCMAPIIVAATLGVASAILLEAYLSFLGLGVRPPTATWGNMLGEAFENIGKWFYWFYPGLCVILTVLGINSLGDGLRDALDPRAIQ